MPRFEVHPEVEKAWTIPSAFYNDPAVFAESKDRIFARSWQFSGWDDLVKVPGTQHPFTLLEGFLDEPLLYTRDREDRIHCLSNVCTHRGNIVCEGAANGNSLRCRYHGRVFNLDGSLRSMPEFDGVEGFPCDKDNLPRVPFGQWRKFLFTCLDPVAALPEVFAELDRRIGWMPIEQFVYAPERAREYLIKGHWALYVDNYLEGFHIPYIHAALNATLDYGSYRTELFDWGNLQFAPASSSEDVFDLPASSPDYGQRVAAYYYWIFPNLMLNFYPWGLSVNVVRPLAPDRTKVNFIPFIWDASKLGEGAGGDLDRVEREDEVVVELVHKGLQSRFYDRGRYSPKRENGVHQFHRLLCEAMNR